MKIEGLKQGQAVWVKGYVDRSVFGGCGGFINFYNKDGNNLDHISRNNVREMKEEDVQIDQPKPAVSQCVIDWVDDSRERDYEFDEWFDPDNQPLEVYKWLNCKNKRQADINALALVTLIVNGPDAVSVEKEKLYTVEIPNPNRTNNKFMKKLMLFKISVDSPIIEIGFMGNPDSPLCKLTEAEIRKDFEWAWQQGFAKEVTE